MTEVRIKFSEEQEKALDEMKRKLGGLSTRELLNNAITLLDWAANRKAEGNEIASVNEEDNVYHVLNLDSLESVD